MRPWKAGVLTLLLSMMVGCASVFGQSASEYFDSDVQQDLAEAAAAGDERGMEAALDRGADPNAVSAQSMTPLFWVTTMEPNLDGLKYLLANGGNPNLSIVNPDYNEDRVYLIELAYEKPYTTAFLQAVLEAGADPNMPVSSGGSTVIFKPLADRYLEHIKMLIDYGIDVNHQNDKYNSTAALGMMTSKNHKALALLINADADPTLENRFGKSLMWTLGRIEEMDGRDRYRSDGFWKVIDALKAKVYIDPQDPYWRREE